MLTLYGDLNSGNVYKVRLLLAQRGMAYRRVDTTQNRGEPALAAFRAINPIGKIPTVVFDDGRMLSESGAILFYFAQASRFWPRGDWDQAEVMRWMFFEQYSHEPYIAVNRHWKLHLPAAEQAPLAERMAANHLRGSQALDVMEKQLSAAEWLAADGYTIADIALFAYTHSAGEGGFNLEFLSGDQGLARPGARGARLCSADARGTGRTGYAVAGLRFWSAVGSASRGMTLIRLASRCRRRVRVSRSTPEPGRPFPQAPAAIRRSRTSRGRCRSRR